MIAYKVHSQNDLGIPQMWPQESFKTVAIVVAGYTVVTVTEYDEYLKLHQHEYDAWALSKKKEKEKQKIDLKVLRLREIATIKKMMLQEIDSPEHVAIIEKGENEKRIIDELTIYKERD